MKKYSKQETDWTIGLDLGNRNSYWVALDREGEILQEGRVARRVRALEKVFREFSRSRIALEVGTQSSWVSRLLRLYRSEPSQAA